MDEKLSQNIVIIGGGPVGLALALLLEKNEVKVLEARTSPSSDPRAIALSYGSRLILERIGVWQNIDATPIEKIHISHKGGFGKSELSALDSGVPALGYVTSYTSLRSALCAKLDKTKILEGACATGISENSVDITLDGKKTAIHADIIVVAEGGNLVEKIVGIKQSVHDYRQWAIVAQIKSSQSQKNTAYERFTPDGPIALLPYQDGYSLVWTTSPELAQETLGLSDVSFLGKLHDHFGDRLGEFVQVKNRGSFPLFLKQAQPPTSKNLVLIGNAAQMLHPVAGQGFNLGLRDARDLARDIVSNGKIDEALAKYAEDRGKDRKSTVAFTDSLMQIFSNENELLKIGRGLGLLTFDCLPVARKFFSKRMMFGA